MRMITRGEQQIPGYRRHGHVCSHAVHDGAYTRNPLSLPLTGMRGLSVSFAGIPAIGYIRKPVHCII